jgi:EAL domain-containing protein (putative c-di-GMP-specific phosphodiesterase class I)
MAQQQIQAHPAQALSQNQSLKKNVLKALFETQKLANVFLRAAESQSQKKAVVAAVAAVAAEACLRLTCHGLTIRHHKFNP